MVREKYTCREAEGLHFRGEFISLRFFNDNSQHDYRNCKLLAATLEFLHPYTRLHSLNGRGVQIGYGDSI